MIESKSQEIISTVTNSFKLYQNQVKIGAFSTSYYWSSTETDIENAWRHNFSPGMSGFVANKGNEYFVRAVKIH